MFDARSAGPHLRVGFQRFFALALLTSLLLAVTATGGACGGDDSDGGGGMGGTNRRTEPGLGGSSGSSDAGSTETGTTADLGTAIDAPVDDAETASPADVVLGPPSIVSTSPAHEAKGVPIDTNVVIEFSKAMNPTSVMVTFTPGFMVRPPAWSAGGETLTLTLAIPLTAGTTYTATVAGTDTGGAALTGSKTFSFTTGTPPDTTAPTITATTPAAGATGVAANAALSITFSEVMDPATVTAKLGDDELDLTFNASSTVATAADAGLKPATMYTVTVAGKDVAGNLLGGTKTFAFTTATPPDTERPKVTDTTPDNAATGVASATEIAIMFSEGMNRTATEAAITISGSVACAGRWLWNTASNFMSCKPAAALAASTLYTVTVGTGATDTAGNALMAAHAFSFTTAALPDLIPPTVSSVLPANAANGIARTATIVVTFSEPMDLASAQTAFQATVNGTAITAAGTYVWSGGGRILTFKPNFPFAYGATVAFSVNMAAKDAAGNAKLLPNNYSFTVIRSVTQTIYAVPALDGYVYSNGNLFPGSLVVLVGDLSTNAYAHGFLTFDLTQLTIPAPNAARSRITSAVLYLNQKGVVGNPYATTTPPAANLGDLLIDHVSYGPTLDAADLNSTSILGGRTIPVTSLPTSITKVVSVTTSVIDDWTNRTTRMSASQFRIRFTRNVTMNAEGDFVDFVSGNETVAPLTRPRISVTYETP